MADKKGQIIVISGPSGVGKTTICNAVVDRLDDAVLVKSMTTRKMGENEENGREYWFVSKEEFEKKIENNEFLEYARVFDNYYGTPKEFVQKGLDEGNTMILEIDVQGGQKTKVIHPDAKLVFILPPSPKILRERIARRGRGEDEETLNIRLNEASNEIAAAWRFYEHMVINADLESAIGEVIDIIQSNGDNK